MVSSHSYPIGPNKSILLTIVSYLAALLALLYRLIRDPRVPRRSKVILGLAIAYVVNPFDLMPDFLPPLGQVDDVMVVVLALDLLIREAGPEIVREHWCGDGDIIAVIEELRHLLRGVVPEGLAKRVRDWFIRWAVRSTTIQ